MNDEPSSDEVLAAALRRAASSPDPELEQLGARLAAAADDEGLLDVAYRTVDSPFGSLLVAATPGGVVRVAFEVEGHDRVLEQLAGSVSPRVLASPRRTDQVARELDEYFDGRRTHFGVDVDLQLVRGFRRQVVELLAAIPYGTTRSYAQVARDAGNPAAVRAVGSACSHNPVPLVLPCHRVVRSDGSVGQYLGGTGAKVALLELESLGVRR
jgi:methylated-DNA-[protein]-cysteine S-methyltransferase